MDLDSVKGVVSALLTDQVDDKTGLAAKIGWIVFAACAVFAVAADGWLRGLGVFVALLSLLFLAFVSVTKGLAKGIINRFAPPADVGDVRQQFSTAIDEADLPTGPAGFMRLIWRLRKGVGPEVERLAAVVGGLRDPD